MINISYKGKTIKQRDDKNFEVYVVASDGDTYGYQFSTLKKAMAFIDSKVDDVDEQKGFFKRIWHDIMKLFS